MEKHITGTLLPPRCFITYPFLKYMAYSHIRVDILKEQFYRGLHPIGIVKRVVLLGSTSEKKTLVLLESSFSRSSLTRVKIQTGHSEGAVLFEPTS